MSLTDIRRGLEHAPKVSAKPRPDQWFRGLQGWASARDIVCVHCADRLIARGCGYMLGDREPVWDNPVKCSLVEQHGG